MKLHFELQEFVKEAGQKVVRPLTPTIADKIMRYHLLPLNEIRSQLGRPIYVTSGYRTTGWELKQGRDGSSQHTYSKRGATDISLGQAKKGTWILLFELLKESPFKRIAYYENKNFFHLDYHAKERIYFNGDWERKGEEEVAKLIRNN